MPIFLYDCGSCGNSFEELFMSRSNIKDVVDCHFCEKIASRREVNWFTHVGPVSDGLDTYNNSFFSKEQRKNGQEVRSYKDIQKYEDERGLCRMEHGSKEYNDYVSTSKQEMYEMGAAYNDGGYTGLSDHISKKEVLDNTNWSETKYLKWKASADKAESAAHSGKVDISQAATAKPQATE
jgi:predicted nucleic acid-binding Zn ribbon protein